MEELNEMCKQSMEAAQFISQSLARKLQGRSALVIIKALRIIKYIASKGNQNFVRVCQREAPIIRELQTYRGEVDPLRGEKPNQRVRELAKEVLPVIYNPPGPQSTNNQLSLQGKIQGFGNQHSMDLKQINNQSTFNLGGFSRQDSTSNSRPNSGQWQRGTQNMAWNQGSAAGNASYRQLSIQTQDSAFASDVLYSSTEERIVGEICSVNNAKSVPLDNDIVNFLEYLANLSGRKVGIAFTHVDTSKKFWQYIYTKKCLLKEKVVEQANSQACQDLCQYIMENPSNVKGLSQNPHKKIRTRAKKLKLYLLGEEDVNPEEVEQETQAQDKPTAAKTETSQQAAQENNSNQADLLGDLLDSGPPKPPQPQNQSKPQTQSNAVDLLGDLQSPATNQSPLAKTPQNTYNPSSLFSQSSPVTQQQNSNPQILPQQNASKVDDLFSGLTLTSRPINLNQTQNVSNQNPVNNNTNSAVTSNQQQLGQYNQTSTTGQNLTQQNQQFANQANSNFGTFDNIVPLSGASHTMSKPGLVNSQKNEANSQQQNQFSYTYPGLNSTNTDATNQGLGFGFSPLGQQPNLGLGTTQNWGQGNTTQQPPPQAFAQIGSDKNHAAFDFISDEINKNKLK